MKGDIQLVVSLEGTVEGWVGGKGHVLADLSISVRSLSVRDVPPRASL